MFNFHNLNKGYSCEFSKYLKFHNCKTWRKIQILKFFNYFFSFWHCFFWFIFKPSEPRDAFHVRGFWYLSFWHWIHRFVLTCRWATLSVHFRWINTFSPCYGKLVPHESFLWIWTKYSAKQFFFFVIDVRGFFCSLSLLFIFQQKLRFCCFTYSILKFLWSHVIVLDSYRK